MKNKKFLIGIVSIVVIILMLLIIRGTYWDGYNKGREDYKEYRDNEVKRCGKDLQDFQFFTKEFTRLHDECEERLIQEKEKIYEGYEIKEYKIKNYYYNDFVVREGRLIDRNYYETICENYIGFRFKERTDGEYIYGEFTIGDENEFGFELKNEYTVDEQIIEFICAKEIEIRTNITEEDVKQFLKNIKERQIINERLLEGLLNWG